MGQAEHDARIEAVFEDYDSSRTFFDSQGRKRPKSYAERLALWEKLWTAVDFSWTGLADAGWERGDNANRAQKLKRWRAPPDFPGGGLVQGEGDAAWRPASLQDYWRWIPTEGWTKAQGWGAGRLATDKELKALGLLVEADSAWWFALHRPEVDVSGQDLQWPHLADAIRKRLALAGPRANARFDGARALGLDAIWRNFVLFSSKRSLHAAAQLAEFKKCKFAAVSFADRADFRFSIFGDSAQFNSARFGDKAGFDSAYFGNNVRFDSVRFGDGARFESTHFGDNARFDYAHFGADAQFEFANFADRADFMSASFGGGASFGFTSFGNGASLFSACFGDNASFESATFRGEAIFSSAIFAGNFRAVDIIFCGWFGMHAAEIKGYANFSRAKWPERFEDQQSAFKGCRFRDVADFETPDFTAFALFDGAEFKGRVLLSDPGEGQSDRLFARALKRAQDAADAERKREFEQERDAHEKALRDWEAAKPEAERAEKPKAPVDPDGEAGAEARLGALTGGLRTLRLAMAAQSDLARAQRFYRYEAKARAKMPSEPRAAKVAAWLYRVSSDYGMSIGRPLLIFGLALLAFAALYTLGSLGLDIATGVAAPRGPDGASLTLGQRVGQALNFSMNNSFRPFSALSSEGTDVNPLARHLLHDFGVVVGVPVRFLALLQSLIAILLAFLLGLALRRRFQIS
jgi:hypothetical protein